MAGTIFDVGDLALTAFRFLRGNASGTDLTVTALGAGAGIALPGAGFGRLARRVAEAAAPIGRNLRKVVPATGALRRSGIALKFNSELEGGVAAARALFQERVGRLPSGAQELVELDGFRILFREGGADGRAKIEIADFGQRTFEKITFLDN